MRLLNTRSLILEFFQDGDTPPYVALSLLQQRDDISYADLEEMAMLDRLGKEEPYEYLSRRSSSRRLRMHCQIAMDAGYEWIWISICCIDWSSRVEVNEHANLAFERFRSASICFVYLDDVHECPSRADELDNISDDMTQAIKTSAWFTRSWTLTELLAPRTVRFFNSKWEHIPDKMNHATLISQITGVSTPYLLDTDARLAPCAEKLSWIADREAGLLEDHVYAVLGLFKIKMDISFGEGLEAFTRFRRAVLADCDGTVHFSADALRRAKNELLEQLGQPPTNIGLFEDLRVHSMLNASLDNEPEWSHMQNLTLEMAKHRPHVIDTRYNFTSICRKVHDFFLVWTQATQEVAGNDYAICVKITPKHSFHATPGGPHISISGSPDGEVFYVPSERLIGFQPCHLYSSIEVAAADLRIFESKR